MFLKVRGPVGVWLICIFYFFPALVYSQTTYTTIASGDWNSGSTWSGGVVPPLASWDAPVKDIYINHNVTLSGTQQIGQGYIRNVVIDNGAILSLGTITISEDTWAAETNVNVIDGGITATEMTINQSATLNIQEGGYITVSGNFTNNWNLTTVNNAGTLTVNNFYNNGTFVSSGALVVNGNFDNHYDFSAAFGGSTTISGNLTSNGNMSVPSGSSLEVGGNFYLHDGKTADVDGALVVGGNVLNNGTIDGDGYMIVDGTVTNNHIIFGNPPVQDCTECCGSGCTLLPVSLTEFSSSLQQGGVKLTWQTASEQDNEFFTLERSWDGQIFEPIVRIGGSGTTQTPTSYSFIDRVTVSKAAYYRLSQTDFDGTHERLKTIRVSALSLGQLVELYPNPVQQGSVVAVRGVLSGDTWALYDLAGHLLSSGVFSVDPHLVVHERAGLYLLKIQAQGEVIAQRIVVR